MRESGCATDNADSDFHEDDWRDSEPVTTCESNSRSKSLKQESKSSLRAKQAGDVRPVQRGTKVQSNSALQCFCEIVVPAIGQETCRSDNSFNAGFGPKWRSGSHSRCSVCCCCGIRRASIRGSRPFM